MARNAWGVMIMEMAFGEWVEHIYFIFCTVNIRTTLETWFVVEVLGHLRKTDIVGASTRVVVVLSANTT